MNQRTFPAENSEILTLGHRKSNRKNSNCWIFDVEAMKTLGKLYMYKNGNQTLVAGVDDTLH